MRRRGRAGPTPLYAPDLPTGVGPRRKVPQLSQTATWLIKIDDERIY